MRRARGREGSRRAGYHDAVDAEPLLVFLHNAKTGGMTLRDIVGAHYARRQLLNIRGEHRTLDAVLSRTELRRPELSIIEGHIPFGVHRRIPRPCQYVSLLREPTDRLVSFFYYSWSRHQQRSSEPYPYRSVAEFLDDDSNVEFDNGQTRRIAGIDPPYGACTRELLELAMDNIRKQFLVVGATEAFDSFLVRLRRAQGWHFATYSRRGVNADRPKAPSLSAADSAAIREHSVLDAELHVFALRYSHVRDSAAVRFSVAFEAAAIRVANRTQHRTANA
jgi:hypothetical protein